jgi:hypothetical protein
MPARMADAAVALADCALTIAPTSPGSPGLWGMSGRRSIGRPAGTNELQPGERVVVTVSDADTNALPQPNFDDAITLFGADGQVSDRVDFIHWPAGASLARVPDAGGALRFCVAASPGGDNAGPSAA